VALSLEDLAWLKGVLDEVWEAWQRLERGEERRLERRRGRLEAVAEMTYHDCSVRITDGERSVALSEDCYSFKPVFSLFTPFFSLSPLILPMRKAYIALGGNN